MSGAIFVHPAARFSVDTSAFTQNLILHLGIDQLRMLEKAVDAHFDYMLRTGNLRDVVRSPNDPSMLGFQHPEDAFLWRIKKLAIATNYPDDAGSRINGAANVLVRRVKDWKAECRSQKPKRKKKKPSTSR